MTTPTSEWQRHIRTVNLIQRYDSVLYPIDLGTLFGRLPEEGWVVPRQAEEGRVEASEMPSKGNVHLRIDSGNKTLGVNGTDLEETIETFQQLNVILTNHFDNLSEQSIDYVEFRYIGLMSRQTSPVEVFADWWASSEQVQRIGQLVAKLLPSDSNMMSPYGIRLAPANLDANRPNWTELTLTPHNTSGDARYVFDLLYRNEDISLVEGVAATANDILEATIADLEQ